MRADEYLELINNENLTGFKKKIRNRMLQTRSHRQRRINRD